MPEIGRIQSTNFQALLTELGIVRNQIPFALRSEVTPVVLVGGTVSFVAAPTPPYQVTDIFSAGVVVAPAVGTVLADTLALPVGAYSVLVNIFHFELGGSKTAFDIEWRNALNTANLATWRVMIPDVAAINTFLVRLDIQNANERIRCLTASASNVGVDYQATIFARI